MCARAALRAGAGIAWAAVPASVAAQIGAAQPELMVRALPERSGAGRPRRGARGRARAGPSAVAQGLARRLAQRHRGPLPVDLRADRHRRVSLDVADRPNLQGTSLRYAGDRDGHGRRAVRRRCGGGVATVRPTAVGANRGEEEGDHCRGAREMCCALLQTRRNAPDHAVATFFSSLRRRRVLLVPKPPTRVRTASLCRSSNRSCSRR